jgi:hypothetical protein
VTETERLKYCREQIEKTVLTDQEREEGYFEAKKKKYFKEKHGQYWEEKEFGIKPKEIG